MKFKSKLKVFIAAAAAFAAAGSASAQSGNSIKPYGNLFVFFGYQQSEEFDAAGTKETGKDTIYRINENSNIGFNFNYSKYHGVFELGVSDSEDESRVIVRKAFGVYKFGGGELMIGQDWTPYTRWSHEAANYHRSEGFGAMYDSLATQLKLSSDIGLYIDIIQPNVSTMTTYDDTIASNPTSSGDPAYDEYNLIEVKREITTGQEESKIKSLLPKTALGYEFKAKENVLGIGAAFNAYKITNTGDVRYDKDWIISYITYAYAELQAEDFLFNFSGGFSVNPANYGLKVQTQGNSNYRGGAAAAIRNDATGEYEIKDTWNVQSYAEVGYVLPLLEKTTLFAGCGFSMTDYPMEGTDRDYAIEYYINAKFNIGGLIALTPSIAYRDYMKDFSGSKEGSDLYAGALATISFY